MRSPTPIPPLTLEYLELPGMAKRLQLRMGLNIRTFHRMIRSGQFWCQWPEQRCYDLVATVLEEAESVRFDEQTERQD